MTSDYKTCKRMFEHHAGPEGWIYEHDILMFLGRYVGEDRARPLCNRLIRNNHINLVHNAKDTIEMARWTIVPLEYSISNLMRIFKQCMNKYYRNYRTDVVMSHIFENRLLERKMIDKRNYCEESNKILNLLVSENKIYHSMGHPNRYKLTT